MPLCQPYGLLYVNFCWPQILHMVLLLIDPSLGATKHHGWVELTVAADTQVYRFTSLLFTFALRYTPVH